MGTEEEEPKLSNVAHVVGKPWNDFAWAKARGLREVDFSEHQERFQQLHAISRQRQFADSRLRQLTDEELIFLAGHTGSAPTTGDAALAISAEEAHLKVLGNALRAKYELDRRAAGAAQARAEQIARDGTAVAKEIANDGVRAGRRTALLSAGIGAAAAVVVLVLGALLDSVTADDPAPINVEPSPVDVTVTVVYPTTTTTTVPPTTGP